MIPHRAGFNSFRTLAFLLLVSLSLAIFGCGSVDWFPAYQRQPTTPDAFTFPTKTNVPIFTNVSSAAITVSGLTADTSPISISGPTGSNSAYAVNGGTATSAAGTVKNGDTVTVSHTSASGPGGSVTSTLSIGNVNGTFTSITQLVTLQYITAPVQASGQAAGIYQADVFITAVDTAIPHQISISSNAWFAIGDLNGVPLGNFAQYTSQYPLYYQSLSGSTILVQNLTPSTASITAQLTIDGAVFNVTL